MSQPTNPPTPTIAVVHNEGSRALRTTTTIATHRLTIPPMAITHDEAVVVRHDTQVSRDTDSSQEAPQSSADFAAEWSGQQIDSQRVEGLDVLFEAVGGEGGVAF